MPVAALAGLTTAEAVELSLAYLEEIDYLAVLAAAAVRAVWDQLGSYDRADIDAFAAGIGPAIDAVRAEAIDMTVGYIATLTGETPTPLDVAALDVAIEAPFLRTWHEIAQGYEWQQAVDSGGATASALGEDTVRDGAARQMGGAKGVLGWRRNLHVGACEWCQVVSTQLYHTSETGTFGHDNCRCIPPLPVTDAHDPALALNKRLLGELRSSGAVKRVSDVRARTIKRDREAASSARSRSEPAGLDATSPAVQALLNL